MAKFEITSPDGKRFEVTAPDGASEDEILSFAQQQTGEQDEIQGDSIGQDGALKRGWNKMIQSVGITGALASGDEESASQKIAESARYQQANPGIPEGSELMAAWQRGDGISGGMSEVAGEFKKDWRAAPSVVQAIRSTGTNLAAMGSGVVEQIPNMIPPMVGMLGGGVGGGMAGGPVGAVGGSWVGASTGNTMVEGGGMAQEALHKAGINPLDTEAVRSYLAKSGDTILTQAGIKGAVIGAVDVVTMGLAGKLLTGPAKEATGRALVDMGVDMADKAAVQAAIKSPELAVKVAADPLFKAATTGAQGVTRNVTAAALEPAGEFAGEYLGQGLATGEYDEKEAFLEAASSIGQSGATFAGQKAYAALKYPFKAGNGSDAPAGEPPVQTADDVLGTPEPTPAAPTESDKALYTPKSLTSLDRVNEIDAKLAETDITPAEIDTLITERGQITAAWPKAMGGAQTSFSTETGAHLNGQYALMESSDLTTSHDENLRPVPTYPTELQPRERERHASEMQVQQIVGKLDPARLGESADVATGAPIVGADGLVESGNARTIALKRVYQANGQTAQDYKNYLKTNANRLGIQPEAIDSMQNPVLVRIRTTPVNRAEFARQANASTVARMSPSEQAKSDAAQMDSLDDLNPDEQGEFISGSSRPFVRRFMAKLPVTEQAGLIDASGQLSQTGYTRIRNAVLAKAYGDSPVLLRMVESVDDDLRNVSKALLRVAPNIAKTREAIGEGALHDADITPDLMAAVEELSELKKKGVSVKDGLAQAGIFGEKISPESKQILKLLNEYARSPRRIAEFIQAYLDALTAAGNPGQQDIFGEKTTPAKNDLMDAARRAVNGEPETRIADAKNNGVDQEDRGQPKDAQGNQAGNSSNEAAGGNPSEEWVSFPQDSGTLGIPRAEMPQIKSEHRGALTQFLKGRGIDSHSVEIQADELKPTQAEFSRKKASEWKEVRDGVDRSVLASSDGHVLDGHHQWVAALALNEPIKVIQFDAPIKKLLDEVKQFPGVKRSEGVPVDARREAINQQWNEALADLGAIVRDHANVARVIPEDTPGLMPTLVKLFEAGIAEVGHDMKVLMAHVKNALKNIPEFKSVWNKIDNATYRKAALQALDNSQAAPEGDLFSVRSPQADQGRLFGNEQSAGAKKMAMIDGRPYDMKRDNYVPQDESKFIGEEILSKAKRMIDQFFDGESAPVLHVSPEDRERGYGILRPMLKLAEEAKVAFDQKIIDISKRTGAIGQMLAPVKRIERSVEKLVNDNKFDSTKMRDLIRSTIVVNSYDDAQVVLNEIGKEFTIQRVKNKTDISLNASNLVVEKSPGGYMDVLVNVAMPNGTVAEIQINIPAMMAAKSGSGHKLYEISRTSAEGSAEKVESESLQQELYAAALAAAKKSASEIADQRSGHHEVSAIPSQGDFSSSTNRLPSGNSTYNSSTPSSSVKSIPNLQPSGNLSGTFISSTSDGRSMGHNKGKINDSAHPVEAHEALFDRLRDGAVTLDEFKAGFSAVVDGKEAIRAELSALTKDAIFKRFPSLEYRYKNEKKDSIIDAAYRSMRDSFALGDSISWNMGEIYEDVIRGYVDKTTDASLQEFADKIKTAKEESTARKKANESGMENPVVLDDYKRILASKAEEIGEGATFIQARMAMTPEQRERFDELTAEQTRGDRKARADQQRAEVRVADSTTEGQIVETKHTKTGEPLFVVKSAERVERDVYNQWNATAKKLGGYYSSYKGGGAIPGFTFKTRENAEAFLQYLGGNVEQVKDAVQSSRDAFTDDRSQTAAARLNEIADRLEDSASAILTQSRKINTARRASMAARAEASARSQQAMAQTMRNIAAAIESGRAKFLDRVRQKVQVERMQAWLSSAQDSELRAKYPIYSEQEKHKADPPTGETADYAAFPQFTAFRSDLARMARRLLETDGTKQLGTRLLKIADDVTAEYKKFAKDNLYRVSTFKSADGKAAVFRTADDAEAAIARSGFNGKATTISFKRGEHLVIMGPEMAKEAGLWNGDTDKRITLAADFADEIVTKAKGRDIGMPWTFETVAADRMRLKAMGIETPAEFRAAMREFVTMREAPKAQDRIKELERKMIGRANDGLDFFPTPDETAQSMIDAADLKDGMSVLEPSAGWGHIAEKIREAGVEPDVVEISGSRRELLEEKGFNLVGSDFMDVSDKYDRVILNPPFSDRRDAGHVQHAYSLLNPGGRLVAIMGEGVFYGQDKKAQAFREWLESVGGTSEKLEEGTFLDPSLPVNTGVNARLVVIDRKETDQGVALLSRSRDNTAPSAFAFSERDVRAKVDDIIVTFKLGGKVSLALGDSFSALPEQAQQDAREQGGNERNTKGVAHRDGTIYILWKNHSTLADVEETIFHELHHLGMRKLFGPQFIAKIGTIFDRVGGWNGIKGMADRHGFGKDIDGIRDDLFGNNKPTGKGWTLDLKIAVLTDEALARIAQKAPTLRRAVDEVYGAIRQWLRKNRFADLAKYNDADIAHLLKQARLALQKDGVTSGYTVLSKAVDTKSLEFKQWFGNSKVVDTDGNPLRMFHGTTADFSAFKRRIGDVGIHFGTVSQANDRLEYMAARPGHEYMENNQNLMPVYLSIQNPLRLPDLGLWNADNMKFKLRELFPGDGERIGPDYGTKGLSSTKDIREFLQSKGYDGIVYKNTGEVAGSEPFHKAIAAARQKMQSRFGVSKSSFSVEDQQTPEYKEHSKAEAAYSAYREANGEDSYIAFERNQIKSALSNTGEFSNKNPDIRLSRANSPRWFSALSASISGMEKIADKQGMVNPAQAKAWLLARQKEGKFKQIELAWSGLTDWLDAQTGRVSVADIAAYLDQGGVRVEEVVLSGWRSFQDMTITEKVRLRAIFESYDLLGFGSFGEAVDAFKENPESWDMSQSEKDEAISITGRKHEKAHFSQWQLKGEKSDYRELLITLPPTRKSHLDSINERYNAIMDKYGVTVQELPKDAKVEIDRIAAEHDYIASLTENQWLDGHSQYDSIQNPIARIRFNTRTDAQGRKILMLEELQNPKKAEHAKMPEGATKSEVWLAMALKRALMWGIENGHEGLAWTTGEQQAARYDLSKQIDIVRIRKLFDNKGWAVNAYRGGEEVIAKQVKTNQELADTVGKDLAGKAIGEMDVPGSKEYRDADLTVGGEGLSSLYNNLVPSTLSKVLRQVFPASAGDAKFFSNPITVIRINGEDQPGIILSDKLKESVSGGVPMLSSRARDANAANALQELAAEDELFRYPVSQSGTLKGIFHDVFPGVEWFGESTRADEKAETGAEHRYTLKTPDTPAINGRPEVIGKQFEVYVTRDKVWIDVHRSMPGDQGSRIYAAVANFAYNTRRVFAGDPAGVSVDAIMARTKMMLASALRFGTTRHLEASVEQEKGIQDSGIEPLNWSGKDIDKLRALIHTFIKTVQNNAPNIKSYRYDFANHQFTKMGEHDAGTARILSGLASNDYNTKSAAIVDAIGGDQRSAARIGADSGRAAILIQSLISEEGRGIGDAGILQTILDQSSALVSEGGLKGLLSRTAGEKKSRMSLRDLNAVVDRVSKGFKNLPRVHVLESPSDLSTKDPSQKALRDFIRKSDAWGDVEGATHEGEIYLFASGMADEARAEHVLATHEITHYGLRGSIGKDLDAALQHVLLMNAKVRKASIAMKQSRKLKSNIEAVEEVLADMPSADLAKLRGWRKVIQVVRDWLNKAGAKKLAARLDAWMKAGLSDQYKADLFVADLVNAARDWVKSGTGTPATVGTRLAEQKLADDLAEQEKWLAREAKARGYKSIDELAEKDYKVFERLAALWRKKHPVDVALMSRSVYAGKDGILDQTTAGETIDGARLKELRRAAAGLESPRKGIFLTVTEDGRAIATGETGTRIPETFIRFARVNGLKFSAQRIIHRTIGSVGGHVGDLTVTTGNKGIINPKSEPMPIEYRESGALYFGESGKSIDRTGKTRFSTSKLGDGNTAAPKQTTAQRAEAARITIGGASDEIVHFDAEGRKVESIESAAPGSKMLVMRLGRAGTSSLENRNAASLLGFVGVLEDMEDFDSPGNLNADKSNEVQVYEVTAPAEYGAYEPLRQQEKGSAGVIGRRVRSGGLWYSFGPDTKAKLVKTIPLAEIKKIKFDGKYGGATEQNRRDIAALVNADQTGRGPMLSRATTASTHGIRNSQTANERAEAIINKPAATPRPLDALLEGATKAVGLPKLTSSAYGAAASILDRYTPEQIKAGMVSDYGIPEAVIDQRAIVQGRQKRQLRAAGTLLEKLSTLTRAESRVAYEWMSTDNPQSSDWFMEQLPPESIKTLAEVEKMIDGLSKEAVRIGQLDGEAYKRNRFAYLHRSYAKHTAELTGGETAARKRAIAVLGDQYKGRGMTDAVDMAKIKSGSPEWWNRKTQQGKADKQLKGERFIRLERRASSGEGTAAIPGMSDKSKGRLLEVAYWPAGEAIPARYGAWDQMGTWEVRDTKGDKLIVWRDFTKQERESMGEIDEARYAIAKTLHGMIHDVETGKYLQWLGQNYAKIDGEAIDGKIVEASDRMRDTYKIGEWVKVPDVVVPGTKVKRYGALAGRYLPAPIWNDVRQTIGFRYQPLGETYAAIHRAWKASKTALSPAVHMNNVMANFVMADWHDVTAGHVLKALRLMTSKDAAADEVLARFGDSGGSIGTWVTKELQQEQLRPLLDALGKELGIAGNVTGQVGVMSALQLALKGRFPSAWDALKPSAAGKITVKTARAMIDLYEAEDQVFRLAAWLKAKEDGATDQVAGKVARKSFLDYNINAPWVQMMRSTALPFVAFTYRAAPMMLEIAAKKPWKLIKLGLLAGAINALGYMLSGGDEDDERKLLPEEKAGRIWGITPKLIRMPWNDANGSPVFLDIRRWIPVGDIFDTGQSHAALPILPSMTPGGPLALMAELMLNKQGFTGKSITLETDTAYEQAAKLTDYLYKAFAPNIAVLPGTYAWTGISNAGSGKTDSFGREQSLAQSIISSVGIKLGSYPPDVLRLNAQRAAQAKMMEIDKNITALKREFQKKGIDRDEFNAKAKAQIEKKRAVAKEFMERAAGH